MSLLKPLALVAWPVAAFVAAYWAWRLFGPRKLHGAVRGLLVFVTGGAILYAAEVAYFDPRYGGFGAYAMEDFMAGSSNGSLEGKLGEARSALSIYYGDTNGRYPETLEVLWKDNRYLSHPLGHADVFAELPGNRFGRAHWYRDTDKIHYFHSVAEADDAGGWGYVNDPKSPEFGALFVNCTHENFRRHVAWNLFGANAPAPAAAEAAGDSARERSPHR